MSNPTHEGRTRISNYDRWLMAIGALKLLEALLFILLGIGLLKMLHKDLVDEFMRLFLALRFDPEGRFANLILDRVALISPHGLKLISVAAFAHAALDIVEGVGLALRKIWAEFVTLVVSILFLPVEFFELVKHFTWLKVGITAVNLAVVVYLIFHVQMRMRMREPIPKEN